MPSIQARPYISIQHNNISVFVATSIISRIAGAAPPPMLGRLTLSTSRASTQAISILRIIAFRFLTPRAVAPSMKSATKGKDIGDEPHFHWCHLYMGSRLRHVETSRWINSVSGQAEANTLCASLSGPDNLKLWNDHLSVWLQDLPKW